MPYPTQEWIDGYTAVVGEHTRVSARHSELCRAYHRGLASEGAVIAAWGKVATAADAIRHYVVSNPR